MAFLRFLGTGDSQGVPRWWCDCKVCTEARTDGRNARTRPSALIDGNAERVLIDAAPEFRLQADRADLRHVDACIVTHPHNDHLAGIGDVADRARWTGERMPLFVPAEVVPLLRSRYPYLFADGARNERVPLTALEDARPSFCGYSVTAIRVPHGFNGWSYALRFERDGVRWGYMTDCLDLDDPEPWTDLDLLVLGASFYHERAPRAGRSVYDVLEAADLVRELAPRRAILTHLGHGVDTRKEAPEGMRYAHDGLTVDLP